MLIDIIYSIQFTWG